MRRPPESAHQYEAGMSYSMQRYMGGNSEALFAMRDGARNVGAVYAQDTWSVAPRVKVAYGGRYARYDYLPDRSLVSPRASVVVTIGPRRAGTSRARWASRPGTPPEFRRR